MKRPFRLFIFSCFALFVTAWWDKGFILPSQTLAFVELAGILALIFLIVNPIAKIVLFPLNMLTFGFFGFVLYLFFIHLLTTYYHLFGLTSWRFPGVTLWLVTIPPVQLNYLANLALSSLSLSSIINTLDQFT